VFVAIGTDDGLSQQHGLILDRYAIGKIVDEVEV
jgi:hypothetical protein